MTQYYDFSFSLQPPVFSPTQIFFTQILSTQAQIIARQHLADTSHTQSINKDTTQSPEKIYAYGFYANPDFTKDPKPTLHFIIHTNQTQALLDFAESIATTLPLSLSFSFIDLQVCDSLQSHQPITIPEYEAQTHFYTATQTQDFLSSEHFGDFDLFTFAKPLMHTQDISSYLTTIFHNLKSNKSVVLDTARGFKECSLTPFKNTAQSLCVMCDISSLKTFFKIHTAQIDILASFEKPFVSLAPKEVFADKFPLDSRGLMLTALPYDAVLQLMSALLLREEITHFFLRDTDMTPTRVFSHTPRNLHTLCVSESGLFIDTAQTQCDFKTLLHTNLAHHIHQPHDDSKPTSSVVFYISSKHPSAILLRTGENFKQLLDTTFEANPQCLIESIRTHYKNGLELVENFTKKLNTPLFADFTTTSIRTDNLTHIFGIAALLLGMHPNTTLNEETLLQTLPHAYDSLLACANQFLRSKGPRIDYILLRDTDNTLTLDYPRIFRSSMSFKCADMENVILAYGFIDSFCEFLATLVRDVQTNYAFGENLEVLLCGDVFGQSIFLERILGFLPKNITLTLPQDGFLDYD